MLCPKCFGRLEPRFSRDVEVDVCEDCGGIFLDRGELRKIIEGAEPVVLASVGSAVQDTVPQGDLSKDSAVMDADPVERRVEFEPSQAEPRRRGRDHDDDDDDRDRDNRKKKSKGRDRDSKDRDPKGGDSKKSKSKKSKKKRKKGWADMLEDVLDDVLDF